MRGPQSYAPGRPHRASGRWGAQPIVAQQEPLPVNDRVSRQHLCIEERLPRNEAKQRLECRSVRCIIGATLSGRTVPRWEGRIITERLLAASTAGLKASVV